MAYLNRALTNFRNAVNAAYPGRDKTSDGWIGDAAHQSTNSDHNPDRAGEPDAGSVDAWDMDVDLRSDNDGAAIEELKRVFQAHPSSRYWIHNRIEASRSSGWRRVRYDGSNPHDKHVHWNTRESHEASAAPWVIEGDDMTEAEIQEALHNTKIGRSGVTVGAVLDTVRVSVPEILANVRALRGQDWVNEQEIVDGVLAGLGGKDLDDAAAALVAAFGDRSAELAAKLAATAQGSGGGE